MYIADGYLFVNVIHYICWASIAKTPPKTKTARQKAGQLTKRGGCGIL